MTPTPKGIGCCEKCSGVVRDENNFGRDYGCLREECSCHAPKGIEELRAKWLAEDVWMRLSPQDNEAVIAFASSVSSARDKEWREKVEALRVKEAPVRFFRVGEIEYALDLTYRRTRNATLDDLLTSIEDKK